MWLHPAINANVLWYGVVRDYESISYKFTSVFFYEPQTSETRMNYAMCVCCPCFQSLNLILFYQCSNLTVRMGLNTLCHALVFVFCLRGMAMCIQAKGRNHRSIHFLKSETRSLLTIISSFSVQSLSIIFNLFDE